MRYESHRWEYDPMRQGHVCLPPGMAVLAVDRCAGCQAFVSDRRLYWFLAGQAVGTILTAALNGLASNPEVGPK